MTATTCPCGVELGPRQDKFCSREHAGRYTRGKRPTPSHCRACSWPMAEDNLYVSTRSDGRTVTRCRRCALARGRDDYEPSDRGQRARPSSRPRQSILALKPAPAPVQRPAWRPAGFAPQPRIPGVSDALA